MPTAGSPLMPAFDVLVLRAQLDPRHVAHAQHRAVGVGAQHDVAELLGRGQPALGLHVDLELLVVADRPRADAADRRLHVLRLDRGDDVRRRQGCRLSSRLVSNQMRIE